MPEEEKSQLAEGAVVAPSYSPYEMTWEEWYDSWKKRIGQVVSAAEGIKDAHDKARMKKALSESGLEVVSAEKRPNLLQSLRALIPRREKPRVLQEAGIEVL